MAFVFRDLTDPEVKTLADVGQKIAALGVEKAKIQTARANAEVGWSRDLAAIAVEEGKLAGELNDIGETLVTEK